MENVYLPIGFFVVWLVVAIMILIGFNFLHSLFMVLKENDHELWLKYGKPWCKLSFPPNTKKMSLPLIIIFKTYIWGFKAPDWAIIAEQDRKVYSRFRTYFILNIFVGIVLLLTVIYFRGVLSA